MHSAEVRTVIPSRSKISRADVVGRGVTVSEIFHKEPGKQNLPGLDPERRSYMSFAAFSDPDGNGEARSRVAAVVRREHDAHVARRRVSHQPSVDGIAMEPSLTKNGATERQK
jgi:hypothetical protein